ncbi:MAG: GNAT family N-acetyltransferase [Mesorhizobium sp.]
MAGPALTVSRAGESDLGFIMATERRPGYEALVGHWEEARHRAALADGSHACFIGRSGSTPIGFVLLRFWNAPERVTLVRRVAVTTPGRGDGRRLLSAVVAHAFRETEIHRLQIGLFPDNLRARQRLLRRRLPRRAGHEPAAAGVGSAQSRLKRAITGTWSDGLSQPRASRKIS